MENLLYNLHILRSRLTEFFSSERYLHPARFAFDHEQVHLSWEKPHDFGLLLGQDRFGRTLQMTTNGKRTNLGNLLDVVPSQGGKSTKFKEQLKTWKGSVIVNDIKGELSRDTKDIRAKFSDIYFINPTGGGHSYDPLLGKTSEYELYAMAKLLLHEAREDSNGIAFTQKAIRMLTLLFLTARRISHSPFPLVAQMAKLGLNHAAKQINEIASDIATQFLDGDYKPKADYADNKYLINSWELLTARMYPLLTDTVVKSLTGADFSISDLLLSKRPVTIYLQWPESEIFTLQPLMKLLWGTFLKNLKNTYDRLFAQNAHHNLQKVLFLIDEGGVTPIPELQEHMATLNGRGMCFEIGIQDLSQLDALYGKYHAQTILNNCSKAFSRQESLSTAEYVSRLLGYKSGFASSESEHHGETSHGTSEQRIPLLSAQEIMQMPDEDVLLFTRGYKPILAKRLMPTVVPAPSPQLLLPASRAMPEVPRLAPPLSYSRHSKAEFAEFARQAQA